MMNIQGLMKQAQMMQKRMEEASAKLAQQEYTGTSGAGMVSVSVNGEFQTKKINIDKSLLSEQEGEVLEDLIVAALNDAHAKVSKAKQDSLSEMTGGLNLGAMKLPF